MTNQELRERYQRDRVALAAAQAAFPGQEEARAAAGKRAGEGQRAVESAEEELVAAMQDGSPRAIAAARRRRAQAISAYADAQREFLAAERALSDGRAAVARLERDHPLREGLFSSLDARVPVLLLPVRLETRFFELTPRVPDRVELRVRIYPDDIHHDGLRRELDAVERAAGQDYWRELFSAGRGGAPGAEQAWGLLSRRYGTPRAGWIATQTCPANFATAASEAALAFPVPAGGSKPDGAPVVRALPDRWVVLGYRQGNSGLERRVTAWSRPIPERLSVGIPTPDPAAADASNWLVNFDQAEENGMAVRVVLDRNLAQVEGLARLIVLGVKATADAAQGAGEVQELLAAHAHTGGLAFIPQGSPTNNTEEVRSAAASASRPGKDALSPPPPPAATPPAPVLHADPRNGRVLARALGLDLATSPDGSFLDRLANADLPEQQWAGDMNRLLWAGTWGYTVDQMLSPAFRDAPLDDWAAHFALHVRARGPLPALRAGRQPYGILPVLPADSWLAGDARRLGLLALVAQPPVPTDTLRRYATDIGHELDLTAGTVQSRGATWSLLGGTSGEARAAVGDLAGDGLLDLVFATSDPAPGRVTVLTTSAEGNRWPLAVEAPLPAALAGQVPLGIALADLDLTGVAGDLVFVGRPRAGAATSPLFVARGLDRGTARAAVWSAELPGPPLTGATGKLLGGSAAAAQLDGAGAPGRRPHLVLLYAVKDAASGANHLFTVVGTGLEPDGVKGGFVTVEVTGLDAVDGSWRTWAEMDVAIALVPDGGRSDLLLSLMETGAPAPGRRLTFVGRGLGVDGTVGPWQLVSGALARPGSAGLLGLAAVPLGPTPAALSDGPGYPAQGWARVLAELRRIFREATGRLPRVGTARSLLKSLAMAPVSKRLTMQMVVGPWGHATTSDALSGADPGRSPWMAMPPEQRGLWLGKLMSAELPAPALDALLERLGIPDRRAWTPQQWPWQARALYTFHTATHQAGEMAWENERASLAWFGGDAIVDRAGGTFQGFVPVAGRPDLRRSWLYRLLRHSLLWTAVRPALLAAVPKAATAPDAHWQTREPEVLPPAFSLSVDPVVGPWELVQRPMSSGQTPLEAVKADRGLAAVEEALRRLSGHAMSGAMGQDDERVSETLRLLAQETLDLCSHRLDAWITSLATRRLQRLREQTPGGLALGGFGWVEDLRMGTGKPSDGFIHAPSVHHASTAAILRSGFLAQEVGSEMRRALNVDLSSRRMRLAQELLTGVRRGQPIAALLGYRFERTLRQAAPAAMKYLATLRDLAPYGSGFAPAAASEELAEGPAAPRNVVDGVALLARWKDDPGFRSLLTDEAGQPISAPDYKSLDGVLREIDGIVDAIQDLSVAEGVHQMVGGNLVRGTAVMDAVSRGDGIPQEVEVLRTPRTGRSLTHRLLLRLDADATSPAAGWSASPRSRAEPRLDAWLGRLLGPPARVKLTASYLADDGTILERRAVGLDVAGLAALDLFLHPPISTGDGESALHQRLRWAAWTSSPGGTARPTTAVDVRLDLGRDPAWGTGTLSVAEAMEVASAVRAVVGAGRPLGPADVAHRTSTAEVVGTELDARLAALMVEVEALRADLDAPPAARPAREALLVRCASFGLAGAPPAPTDRDEDVARRLLAARAELTARQSRIAAAITAEEKIKIALGPGGVVLPVVQLGDERARLNGALKKTGANPGELNAWLCELARARPTVAKWEEAETLTRAVGGGRLGSDLRVAQFPAPDAGSEPWAGAPAGRMAQLPDKGSRLCIVMSGPAAAPLPELVCGLFVDEWTETVPNASEVTAWSFHFDAPGATPPHAALLAVPPASGRHAGWNLSSLEAAVVEALELARLRLVDWDALNLQQGATGQPGLAQFLPALFFAREIPDPSSPQAATSTISMAL